MKRAAERREAKCIVTIRLVSRSRRGGMREVEKALKSSSWQIYGSRKYSATYYTAPGRSPADG